MPRQSALMTVKNVVITLLSDKPKGIRIALTEVLNEIEGDLNNHGYEHSSLVDTALEKLDKALIELDSIPEPDSPSEQEFTIKTLKPDKGYQPESQEE